MARMRIIAAGVIILLLGFVSPALGLKPLVVRGSQFVEPDSETRFQIVGVDYQPGGAAGYDPHSKHDILTDANACLRDAVLLQRLGVNTIRIYNINPTLNHDECVSIFNAAGIYIMLDVNAPMAADSLNRKEPWTSYHKGYLTRIFRVVESFKDYPNTLALFAGNEVINEASHEKTPAYIRAVQRDLKDYIANHSSREIPVGYSAADVRNWLSDTWNYVSCDDESWPSSRADFFGLNSYSWCGDSTYSMSGYDKLVEIFSESPNPIFFSEYGCNEVRPRIFTEVEALYGEEMIQAFGGGLIYEYTQEENEFGLVKLHPNGTASLLPDYHVLRDQYMKLDINMIQSLIVSATTNKAPKCRSSLITSRDFLRKFDLPKPPPGVEDLLRKGVLGASRGKLVDVKKMTMNSDIPNVYDVDGRPLEGLQFKHRANDHWNLPGDNTSGGSPNDARSKVKSEPASDSSAKPNTVGIGLLVSAGTAVWFFYLRDLQVLRPAVWLRLF